MWLPILTALWRSRSERRTERRKPVSPRLTVEALEDRCTPSFLPPVTSPGGGALLAAGDFNNDGRADIVFISGKDNLTVSLSKGDGTFQQFAALGVPPKETPYLLAAKDVNGDGNLDIVLNTYVKTNKTVQFGCVYPPCGIGYVYHIYEHVWLGAGDASFSATKTTHHDYISSTPPGSNWYLAYGDFNQDGNRDAVQVFPYLHYDTVRVALGNSDGAFLQDGGEYPAGPSPINVAAGDFNGDGWLDVAVTNSLPNGETSISVLFNDGKW
ncbi:MAG TPA: VCBS repeat-containing protein [Gemmataceae bacterium]|nr:VCBS repeat-containing protein [Gemmataceae bacterium]